MKIFLLLISLGLMVCSQSKSTHEKSTMIGSTCDTTISMGLHSSFSLLKPIIQGTGYEWQIVSQTNPTLILQQPKELLIQKSSDDKDGKEDMQLIKLITTDKVGNDTIVLHYFRSFEKNKTPEKVCTVVLIVK